MKSCAGSPLWRATGALGCLALLVLGRGGLVGAHQPHDPISSVAVSPTFHNDRTLFVATGGTTITLAGGTTRLLMKSTDGGLTFQVAPNFPNFEIGAVTISPGYAGDGTLFVATAGGGLQRSTDRGNTWTDVAGPLGSDVVALSLSPTYATDGTLFAARGSGEIFISQNRGGSWTPLPLSAPVSAIAISPAFAVDRTVVAGSADQGVFVSTDGGAAWNAMTTGLSNLAIKAVAIPPTFALEGAIYAATDGDGVFKLQAGTWTAATSGITDSEVTALTVSPAYAADRTLFAATRNGGVFVTTDAGSSWQPTGVMRRELSDQTGIHFRSIGISPAYHVDRTVFMGTFEGLWRSQDAGTSWRFVDLLPPTIFRSISLSPAFGAAPVVFASTYGGGMTRSTDGGASWESPNTSLVNCYPDPTGMSPGYPADRTVFVGTVFGLEKLVEGQGPWQFLTVLGARMFPRTLAVSPSYPADKTVLIGSDNLGTGNPTEVIYNGNPYSSDGLFKSTDGGINWAPTGLNGAPVHSIAFSPSFASDATIFAAGLGFGLKKSTDGGQTFASVAGPAADCCAGSVVVSPTYATDQTVFVAMPLGIADAPGVYRSTDGGATWTLLGGSGSVSVFDMAISPAFATDGTLFVGTLERGVVVSRAGGPLEATGLAEPLVTTLAVSPAYATDRVIYASAYRGLFKSQDGGATWTQLPRSARYEEDRPDVARFGNWATRALPSASCNRMLTSNSPSDALQFTFFGTRVKWIGSRGPALGIARVYLDGVLQGDIDLYAPVQQPQQTLFVSPDLPAKGHVLAIVVTGERNPAAADVAVTFDAFDVSR